MNKKGYTLVEIIAAIGLIAILFVIVIPTVLHLINERDSETEDATNQIVTMSIQLYLEKNPNQYNLNENDIYCISVEQLIDAEALNQSFINNSRFYSEDDIFKITVLKSNMIEFEIDNTCSVE